jgi:protein phosphatase 1L
MEKISIICKTVFAETRQIGEHEVGLFAVFDGYECQELPKYLKANLFNNILKHPTFLFNPKLEDII